MWQELRVVVQNTNLRLEGEQEGDTLLSVCSETRMPLMPTCLPGASV